LGTDIKTVGNVYVSAKNCNLYIYQRFIVKTL
jgi:hypothetical protein